MPESDPYYDNKPYHMANLFSPRGDVSPLCARKPRRINLNRELWTIRREAVTCKRCLKILGEKAVQQDAPQQRSTDTHAD